MPVVLPMKKFFLARVTAMHRILPLHRDLSMHRILSMHYFLALPLELEILSIRIHIGFHGLIGRNLKIFFNFHGTVTCSLVSLIFFLGRIHTYSSFYCGYRKPVTCVLIQLSIDFHSKVTKNLSQKSTIG
ncbi:hypothetical protein Acr_00g0100730 [Actinidia rufa]|uniref:Uncharacterized protein n=1 Tax=Actinidia rufa TaxID=165716 RepID=A0A7J0E042_9ERIC|nr:hypothetical protein Acr_00g0100730 [Actinidia rufa]